jgi:hypothetical protein
MRIRLLAPICLVMPTFLCAVWPVAAQEKALRERWQLKLVPDQLPSWPDELYGTTWVHHGLRTRSGRGHSDVLAFRKTDAAKPAQVSWTQITHNLAEKKEKTLTLPLRVEKALLEYGDQVRTAMIHQGVLALNVGVPVGERTWYQAYCQRFSDGKTRVQEWLFVFEDDPRKKETGKLRVKHASRLFPDGPADEWDVPATFSVKKASAKWSTFNLTHDNKPGESRSRLPRLYLGTDLPYIALDASDGHVIEYKAQK